MDTKQTIINNITMSLSESLSDNQIEQLRNTLYIQLNEYDIQDKETHLSVIDSSSDNLLKQFIATKKIEGRSDSTLKRYYDVCYFMIHGMDKPLEEVTTFDLRLYLAKYQSQRKVSNRTLDGMRRCIKSFFSWLFAEGFIKSNPSLALSQIKYNKTIKQPYKMTDMEKIKRSCANKRDRALVEFLYSTGCRVSEVANLNRSDVDYSQNEIVVFGKGHKERRVYINDVTMMYLQEYLDSRNDTNEALFVSIKSPYERLHKSGIEAVLKKIGNIAGVENVHPHRYRRTLATNLLNRGVAIQDVASILGHEDLKTTQIYCCINQENVKRAYERHIS